MFSHFFIDRPIFASVLSIVIFFAGLVAVYNLPVAQYPPITPPSIMVQAVYPGANGHDVADAVAAPIEQQINGVEDMMYMVSQSNNDGSYNLTVTFRPGVNLNFAQVLVQNRINLAMPNLPDVVKQAGVITRKRNPDILQVIAVYSPNGRYDQKYLSNFTTIMLKDEIARVEGVGDCQQFGQQDFSMRIWVDPDKLASLNMTAADVARAVREQNRQIAAGQIGGTGDWNRNASLKNDGPVVHYSPGVAHPKPAARTFPLTVAGRLSEPEEFENIVIRTEGDGRRVRVKDVARVELGAKNLDTTSRVDSMPNASLAVWALPDANSISTARRVRERMDELKRSFPDDIEYTISLDMTPFIQESINEVIHTLVEAIVLVAIVVMVFLQNWRSAIIPLVAVPVAIVGTFAVMIAIGFSLNTLTMFGLVLAVGIVVDDAIVVVEAVEHHIEAGLPPRAAAHMAMYEVSGPVVAVALVLSAVFVPCAFISGITGMFFRQFALTIAVSTVISAFNSLTLSPALAALLLQPRGAKKDWFGRLLDFTLGWFFQFFNWLLQKCTGGYLGIVGFALRGSAIVLVIYVALLGLTWWTARQLPAGYIPNQDQGRFYVALQLPDSASLERTQRVVDRIGEIFHPNEAFKDFAVTHTTGIAGQSFTLNANGSNFGQFFITLDEFAKRRDPAMHSFAVTDRAKALLEREIHEGQVSLFYPPAVSGLGSASGFKIIIEDRGDLGVTELQRQLDRVIAAGNEGRFKLSKKSFDALESDAKDPLPAGVLDKLGEIRDHEFITRELFDNAVFDALRDAGITDPAESKRLRGQIFAQAENRKVVGNLFSIFRANTPQLFVDINRAQCQTMGVNPSDVFSTLQIYLGSYYVNDFNQFGRTWQVIVQARGAFRDDPNKIRQLKVRNAQGEMVPLGSVVEVKHVTGPINIGRYNMYHAAAILGGTKPGVSSGEGIEEMEAICREVLPQGMEFEWTEINFMQIDAAKNIWNQLIFPLAVVCVFLVLAAQYESWSLPLAVILVVPMCILASLGGVWVTKGDINIFTQIGFVVLVGLASKNAILIVEFAKHKHEEGGMPRREATLAACKLRLRPILMTSFAFILGVVPLLVTTGAGAEMRRTLGTAVFSGMLGVTIFGIFLTPVFFYTIAGITESSLFASPEMRRIALVMRYVAAILSLGLPWLLRGRPRPEPDAVRQERVDAIIDISPGNEANGTTNGVHAETNGIQAPSAPTPENESQGQNLN
ncbi:MAG TPA: efflux RND transporter permease subunit [Gemmataceae bacterium]|nr:efflux RND transporter permease subunit [Gemmataceae bacterium]